MIENNGFSMFWRVGLRPDRMGCGQNANSCSSFLFFKLNPCHSITNA